MLALSSPSVLFATDQASSVLSVHGVGRRLTITYDPFGYGAKADAALTGFNGQHYEQATRTYLLGNGYRAFNPLIRRFHSPDAYSPFGAGGYNAYCYGAGDPLNRVDPTGHFWQLLSNAWQRLRAAVPWRGVARRNLSVSSVHSAGLAEYLGQRSARSSIGRASTSSGGSAWSSSSSSSSSSLSLMPGEYSQVPRDPRGRRANRVSKQHELETVIRDGEYKGLDMSQAIKTLNKRYPGAYSKIPPPAPTAWQQPAPLRYDSRPQQFAPPPYETRSGRYNASGRAGQTGLPPPRYPEHGPNPTTLSVVNEGVRTNTAGARAP
ncbi:MAG: RHS repeat-associated core domain-containing protein [Janthinobacterium lividum]|uniref:RHS repeat-associated core domain-containing protein n=1 Tax=Pseudomonas sp. MWU16-30317 TaxID=2878095 RepID=UPI001CFB4C82|nr:RHS repeat-associated core domain-containing protein [Pseudomonas sp. MWU16-30317]